MPKSGMNYVTKNKLLIALIVISLIPTVFVLRFDYLDGTLRTSLFFARLGAVLGTILLVWQIILGARGLVKLITPDLSFVIRIHKWIGKYAALLIIIHPIFYVIYFWLERGINLLVFDFGRISSVSIFIGLIATIVLLFIWISSVALRSKLKFRPWQLIHYLAYVIVPLVLIHAVLINKDPLALSYWFVLGSVFTVTLIYQILFRFNTFRSKYEVLDWLNVADNTFSIVLRPMNKSPLNPKPGQFVYVKHPIVPEAHPFSVSSFDLTTNQITITVKDLGQFSHMLETVQVGDKLYLDGPYGVFTSQVQGSPRNIVLLAGGIGITPFMHLLRNTEINKEVLLFYGNREQKDIAFEQELNTIAQQMPNKRVVHVLEDSTGTSYLSGYITKEHLIGNLSNTPVDYDYYICGPSAMMKAMHGVLTELGVSKSQIFSEDFAY